jgi:hypothetical protein
VLPTNYLPKKIQVYRKTRTLLLLVGFVLALVKSSSQNRNFTVFQIYIYIVALRGINRICILLITNHQQLSSSELPHRPSRVLSGVEHGAKGVRKGKTQCEFAIKYRLEIMGLPQLLTEHGIRGKPDQGFFTAELVLLIN